MYVVDGCKLLMGNIGESSTVSSPTPGQYSYIFSLGLIPSFYSPLWTELLYSIFLRIVYAYSSAGLSLIPTCDFFGFLIFSPRFNPFVLRLGLDIFRAFL
jgi:hypothetical protein